jgi:hypothetical protein
MLHAAYDRLNSHDKDNVNNLLQDYYKNHLHDRRVVETIHLYKKTEPRDLVNEMHSIFGTEIGSLPKDLEKYYSKYFINRSVVTSYAAAYQNEFTKREAVIKADEAKLAQMKVDIEAQEQGIQGNLDQINTDRAGLDTAIRSSSRSEYRAMVINFNNEVDVYNNKVENLQAKIAAYNRLVNEVNAIASELASLSQSLDTRFAPQTTQ